MKITDITTIICGNPWKNWLFTRVETDEGIHGIGEGTINALSKTAEAMVHELKPLVIGMDPFQTELIVQKLQRDIFSEGGQVHGCAISAIEIACWDIKGKALKQPIYNLLGGRCHEKLRAYANGWYRGPRKPESFAKKAKEVVRRGYTALKFDPFGSNWRMMTPEESDLTYDICAAVRDAVGPKVDILIEGHCRFSVAEAIKFGERITPLRPGWFEEPVPHTNIAAMVEVARHLNFPVACGESLSSKQQFAELLKHDAVHIIQLEPLFVGGFGPAKQICGMVDAHFGVTAPHSAQGPVCSAACAHLNASTPNFYIHEIFDDYNEPWEKDIVIGGVEVKDGYIEPSNRPGLGLDLNWKEIKKHPHQQGYWLPLFKSGWEKREGEKG
ncbi:MAG: mandelate racemase/muconate lactonizing enzyme family protein [Verrucomicrobia bacterium]|nr:mandelate racemase/muconate lactonizing enzyme family protein [Verrucomicrobiota bacterium]